MMVCLTWAAYILYEWIKKRTKNLKPLNGQVHFTCKGQEHGVQSNQVPPAPWTRLRFPAINSICCHDIIGGGISSSPHSPTGIPHTNPSAHDSNYHKRSSPRLDCPNTSLSVKGNCILYCYHLLLPEGLLVFYTHSIWRCKALTTTVESCIRKERAP